MSKSEKPISDCLAQRYAQACARPSGENLNGSYALGPSAKRVLYGTLGDTELTDQRLGSPLSIAEVAGLLGCSVWTVRQKYLPQGLPHLRASAAGRIVFFREQVITWILNRQQKERRK
jgi:hypothetical protein